MSEIKKALDDVLQQQHRKNITTIVGVVVDYSHVDRTVTVEMANPAGFGTLKLGSRPLPETGTGFIPAKIEPGWVAVMTAPMGDYNKAQVVSITPPDGVYDTPEVKNRELVPRSGKVAVSVGRLGYARSIT